MRKFRNFLAIVSATITLGGAVIWFTVRPWWHRWGVNPDDAERELPGDDLVPGAPGVDTRSIEIDAPPAAVWPWLVQMGFGRAGWYSYDAIDMKGSSAKGVVPELQTLAAGDVVPTHPTGGFLVRVLEPGHALVLYSDAELVREQAKAAATSAAATPANLQAAGAFMETAQPGEFRASWAFVLEPVGPGGSQTRLIERFRIEFSGDEKPWMKATLPMMGFGVFVMMRKQMLGIRDRAERLATAGIGSDAWTTGPADG